jgi:hypothetical protein
MLREKLKGKKEKDYIDIIEYLLSDNISNRAIMALEKQAENIITYLESNSLVENLEDAKDKTFDRGKMFLKDLPDLVKRIQELKTTGLNLDDKTSLKEKAAVGSIMNFVHGED